MIHGAAKIRLHQLQPDQSPEDTTNPTMDIHMGLTQIIIQQNKAMVVDTIRARKLQQVAGFPVLATQARLWGLEPCMMT